MPEGPFSQIGAHIYDAHGPPYFIRSSGVMQFREVCYTLVSYAPYMYILLQIYNMINRATFRVTIFDFFTMGPSLYKPPHSICGYMLGCWNVAHCFQSL